MAINRVEASSTFQPRQTPQTFKKPVVYPRLFTPDSIQLEPAPNFFSSLVKKASQTATFVCVFVSNAFNAFFGWEENLFANAKAKILFNRLKSNHQNPQEQIRNLIDLMRLHPDASLLRKEQKELVVEGIRLLPIKLRRVIYFEISSLFSPQGETREGFDRFHQNPLDPLNVQALEKIRLAILNWNRFS